MIKLVSRVHLSIQSILAAAACFFIFTCTRESPQPAGLITTDPSPGAVSAPLLRVTLPASWDENWFASPAVFDLDNDGMNEIVAARHSVLYVWKSDGTLFWRAPVGENASTSNDHGSSRMYCSPVVGDLNGDGFGEIAICYSNKVAVYGYNGSLLAGWPVSFPNSSSEIRSITACDLDRDGSCDILAVKTSDGPVAAVWNLSGELRAGWPQVNGDTLNDYGGYNQNIGCADLDNNGAPDIVCTYDICHIGVMLHSGAPWKANPMFKGRYSCNVPMFHELALAIQGWGGDGNDRDEFTDSPPAFADLDGDNLPEIVLFSDHERAGEYVNRGNSFWVINPDMTRCAGFEKPLTTGMPLYTGYQDNIVQVCPAPCITRLGAATPNIIVPSYDGWMRCCSSTGTFGWELQFNSSGEPFIGAGEAVAGDLDDDGISEIIFTTYAIEKNRSHLFIVDNAGKLLHRVLLDSRGSMAAPTLADVDNDGIIEIIVSLKDALGGGKGGVQIWNVASAKKNRLDWPTGRGNYLRTGEFRPE